MAKQQSLLHALALSIAGLVSACGGDTTNNYYGTVPPMEQKYENPCGNSPVFDTFLWEISSCIGSLHMKTDCTMDFSQKDNAQDIEDDYKPVGSYDGLNLLWRGDNGIEYMIWLDPDARAVNGPSQRTNVAKLNEILDRYHGFIMLGTSDFRVDAISKNAVIPLGIPSPGKAECRGTPYSVPNIPN